MAVSFSCISSETPGRGWRSWEQKAKAEGYTSSQDLDTMYLWSNTIIPIRKNCSRCLHNDKEITIYAQCTHDLVVFLTDSPQDSLIGVSVFVFIEGRFI